jgi:hypothetical protein
MRELGRADARARLVTRADIAKHRRGSGRWRYASYWRWACRRRDDRPDGTARAASPTANGRRDRAATGTSDFEPPECSRLRIRVGRDRLFGRRTRGARSTAIVKRPAPGRPLRRTHAGACDGAAADASSRILGRYRHRAAAPAPIAAMLCEHGPYAVVMPDGYLQRRHARRPDPLRDRVRRYPFGQGWVPSPEREGLGDG